MKRKNTKNKIKEIAKKYNLEMVLLFGSQCDKKFIHDENDFDIGFLGKKDLTGKEQVSLNCDLMVFFNSNKIDLTDLKTVNPFLRQEIAQNSQLLYGNQMDYLKFRAFAFRDYIIHQKLFDLGDILIKKRQQLLKEKIYGK